MDLDTILNAAIFDAIAMKQKLNRARTQTKLMHFGQREHPLGTFVPPVGQELCPGVFFEKEVSRALWLVRSLRGQHYNSSSIFKTSGDELTNLYKLWMGFARGLQTDELLRCELVDYELATWNMLPEKGDKAWHVPAGALRVGDVVHVTLSLPLKKISMQGDISADPLPEMCCGGVAVRADCQYHRPGAG